MERKFLGLAAIATVLLCTFDALAAPTLRLAVAGPAGPFWPGDMVTFSLSIANLGSQPAAGMQAFLQFDTSKLQFLEAHYTAVPFGLPVISPIVANGPNIDLASGINVFSGQTPTAADSTLVFLEFRVLQATCHMSGVDFRAHDPSTKITDENGNELLPLVLENVLTPTCVGDVVPNAAVDVSDLLLVINTWGQCAVSQPCCADINDDGAVNVSDLLAVINHWGPCP